MSAETKPFLTRLRERAERALELRRAAGTERRLSARKADSPLLDLSNNDYLGFSRHPRVVEAAREALQRWGASSSASPLISGYTEAHEKIETELCAWAGFEHGLVWNAGFSANRALLGSLAQKGDLIVADKLVHNSLLAGAQESGANLVRFPHNDMGALARVLATRRPEASDGLRFVVTESVYSMDGDYPDLRRLAALKTEHGFVWLLDEAHALGWYGPAGAGLAAAQGVSGQVDLLVGTLGKALGSMGAFSLFHAPELRPFLINHSRDFIYSTYLPPSCAAAASASLGLLRAMNADDFAQLARMSREWRAALAELAPSTPNGESPVIPIPLGETGLTLRVAQGLLEKGFKVGAIRPPTVPSGGARLRLSLRRGLGRDERQRFLDALREELK